ncbi:MAG: ferric reductase [Nocardioides sp.]|nr:ferric reductase [Nocardioides sp.]
MSTLLASLTDGPLLWYLNRGTGITLMALLSASTALGVLALRGRPAGDGGGRVPRFVRQSLHRNLALLSVVALVVHVVTAVLDTYVDIRWWQAFVPWGSAYEPLWTGLGALSLDLMLIVTVTSLLRHRLGHRAWRIVHYSSWAAWAVGIAHGIGIGTDLRDPSTWSAWAVVPAALSVLVVGTAAVARLVLGSAAPARRTEARRPDALVGAGR